MEPENNNSSKSRGHQEVLNHFLGALGFVLCLLGALLGGKYLKLRWNKIIIPQKKLFQDTICQNFGNIIIVYNNKGYDSEIELNKKREQDKKAIFTILEKVGIAHDEIAKCSSCVERYDENLESKKSIINTEDLIFSLKYQLPIDQLTSIIKNSKIDENYKNSIINSLDTEKKKLLETWKNEARYFPQSKNFEFALKQQMQLNNDLISKIKNGKIEEKYKNEILDYLKNEHNQFFPHNKIQTSNLKEQCKKNKNGKLLKSSDTLIIQTQNLNKLKSLKKIIGSILIENNISGNISINNPSGKILYIEFEIIPDTLLEILQNKYTAEVQNIINKVTSIPPPSAQANEKIDDKLKAEAMEPLPRISSYITNDIPDLLNTLVPSINSETSSINAKEADDILLEDEDQHTDALYVMD